MTTKTAHKRPFPAKRRRKKKRGLVEQAAVDLGVVCARLAWKGAKGVGRWSGRHGLALTVRGLRATGAPVRSWADDFKRFGHLGHADCECGWHGPPAQLAAHEAEHDGDTPPQRPARPSGDMVRDGEPRRRVRAQATRLDREVATADGAPAYACPNCDNWKGRPADYRWHMPHCTGLHPALAERADETEAAAVAATTGKEIQVSEIGQGLQALGEYEITDSRDVPDLLREIEKGFKELAEQLEALHEDMAGHQIADRACAQVADVVEHTSQSAEAFRLAAEEVDEQVENMPTYGLEKVS